MTRRSDEAGRGLDGLDEDQHEDQHGLDEDQPPPAPQLRGLVAPRREGLVVNR